MPGKWLRRALISTALLVVACGPEPTPLLSLTPPPEPADAVPWIDLVWAPGSLPPAGFEVETERIVAVSAGPDGFVAVGYHEAEGERDGVIWFSPDGADWSRVDRPEMLANIEMLDVASVPDGFVGLAIASGGAFGDTFQTVFLRSDDGRDWRKLPPTAGTIDTFPITIAAGVGGALAVGHAADGEPATWRSSDGETFERVVNDGPAAEGVGDPQAGPDGFRALGLDAGMPTLMRSTDGASWEATRIDGGADLVATELALGRWGQIVMGLHAPTCGASASCPGRPIAWWSGDGATWGRLPDGAPTTNGGSIVVPAGDHGFVAIDGASAWASTTGWNWTTLPEPGDGSIVIDAAVVRDDVIVAVGEEVVDDGTTVGRILVGR
ncbi:MAG: hypothetical protein ACRDIL_00075 [Candidatus Limnocylindrales bacterium]